MDLLEKNPFTTIKANDLDDYEINQQWVDIHDNAFVELFAPRNKMAMYIVGGKGSGKTHLMRYFSSPAQMIRHKGNELAGIQKDGYFGVYFQASALHSSRFEYLPFDEPLKINLFIYAFELWAASLFLNSIETLKNISPELFDDEEKFCIDAIKLFNYSPDAQNITNLSSLIQFLTDLSRNLDIVINNAIMTEEVNVEILTNSGSLIFGLPKLVSKYCKNLEKTTFLYLADELENIGKEQQKYINTLVREKQLPVTFRVGARRHGIHTLATLGAGEVNKEGHEFEYLKLDDVFVSKKDYENFALKLILNRLVSAKMAPSSMLEKTIKPSEQKEYVENFFEQLDLNSQLSEIDSSKVFDTFKSKLSKVKQLTNVDELITLMSYPKDVTAELAAIHLFCQSWAKKKTVHPDDLLEIAHDVNNELKKLDSQQRNKISDKIGYYKNNYIASALRSKNQNNFAQYLGLNNILELTKGFPRHILTVLRHIYKLEVFDGRTPFHDGSVISLNSQKLALKESADWFHGDCVSEGAKGNDVAILLDRLCEVLRIEYYADKPVECSASSFTFKKSALSKDMVDILEWAEKIRVIILADQPRQDKNSQQLIDKYHINGLLCPRWGLPIDRRGAISFNSSDAEIIFNTQKDTEYKEYIKCFKSSRYAPFSIDKGSDSSPSGQQNLGF